MKNSRENKRGDSGTNGEGNADFAFSQQPIRFLAVRKGYFAVVFDHAHHVIAKSSNIGRHRFFARKLLTVNDEFRCLHVTLMQGLFIRQSDFGRQFGGT